MNSMPRWQATVAWMMGAGLSWLMIGAGVARWGLGVDLQRHPSHPFRLYLHAHEPGSLQRGDFVTFRPRGFDHLVPKHGLFVKRIAAMGGDQLQVIRGELRINGKGAGRVDPIILANVGRNESPLADVGSIPEGWVLLLGESQGSFDGRYFGLVAVGDVGGKAWPVW